MKTKQPILLLLLCSLIGLNAKAQMKQTQLPNGWKISPIGKQIPLEDLPLNIVLSPNKKLAAITNNGQSTQIGRAHV